MEFYTIFVVVADNLVRQLQATFYIESTEWLHITKITYCSLPIFVTMEEFP